MRTKLEHSASASDASFLQIKTIRCVPDVATQAAKGSAVLHF
jgi:hypothetical protein